eukprot:snap_masked-scaffold_24-processed-gene-3.32-mRNA-1 protein AED:0.83 eAED:1.00 QI:0/0/0/0.5/1/1/2/0/798
MQNSPLRQLPDPREVREEQELEKTTDEDTFGTLNRQDDLKQDLVSVKGVSLQVLYPFFRQVKERKKFQKVLLVQSKTSIENEHGKFPEKTTFRVEDEELIEYFSRFEKLGVIDQNLIKNINEQINEKNEVLVFSGKNILKIRGNLLAYKNNLDWSLEDIGKFCIEDKKKFTESIDDIQKTPIEKSYYIIYNPKTSFLDFVGGLKNADLNGISTFLWLDLFGVYSSDNSSSTKAYRNLYCKEHLIQNSLQVLVYIDNWEDPNCLKDYETFWSLYQALKINKSCKFFSIAEDLVALYHKNLEPFEMFLERDFFSLLIHLDPNYYKSENIEITKTLIPNEKEKNIVFWNVIKKIYQAFNDFYCFEISIDASSSTGHIITRSRVKKVKNIFEWIKYTDLLIQTSFFLLKRYNHVYENISKNDEYMNEVLDVVDGYLSKAGRVIINLEREIYSESSANITLSSIQIDKQLQEFKRVKVETAVLISILNCFKYRKTEINELMTRQQLDTEISEDLLEGERTSLNMVRQDKIARTIFYKAKNSSRELISSFEGLILQMRTNQEAKIELIFSSYQALIYKIDLNLLSQQEVTKSFESLKNDINNLVNEENGYFLYNLYGKICLKQGFLLIRNHKFESGIKVLKEGKEIYENNVGVLNESYAQILEKLGIGYAKLGNFVESLEHWEKAVQCFKKSIGTMTVEVTRVYTHIASAHKKLNNIQEAEKFYLLSAKKAKLLVDVDEERKTDVEQSVFTQLGLLYEETQHPDKAIKYYKECYKIRKRVLGSDHIHTVSVKNKIEKLSDEPAV